MIKYKTIQEAENETKRKIILDNYRKNHEFRVSIGKSSWVNYEQFNPKYNLREILTNEIVIEFDNEDRDMTWTAINLTGVNLYKKEIAFEIWDHEGKSPHLHIHDLPCKDLTPEKRRTFKKVFIRNFVPLEYLKWADISLTGIHLIAIEWQQHWKGCYDSKKLLSKFNPLQDNTPEVKVCAGASGEKLK